MGPLDGSKKEKRNYGKVKNDKTMLKVLSFIWILYLRQLLSATLFEKSLFSNKFFSFTFHSKMTVHTAEKDQMKYFVQN